MRNAPRQFLTISQKVKIGGEGGIRTLVPIARKPLFESGTFDHSDTSPCGTYPNINQAENQGDGVFLFNTSFFISPNEISLYVSKTNR